MNSLIHLSDNNDDDDDDERHFRNILSLTTITLLLRAYCLVQIKECRDHLMKRYLI